MLKRLFSFKGRIGRLEYFLTALFTGVITLPITYAEEEAPLSYYAYFNSYNMDQCRTGC